MAAHRKMTIVQWNVRSVLSNKADLAFLLNCYEVDVALLSETWLKPNQVSTLSGYHVIDQIDMMATEELQLQLKTQLHPPKSKFQLLILIAKQ